MFTEMAIYGPSHTINEAGAAYLLEGRITIFTLSRYIEIVDVDVVKSSVVSQETNNSSRQNTICRVCISKNILYIPCSM